MAFADHCGEHIGTGDETEGALCRVQRREWELLLDWCFRLATG